MMASIWPFSKACNVHLFIARIFKPEMNAKSVLDRFNLRDVGTHSVQPFAKVRGILLGIINVMINMLKLRGGAESRLYLEHVQIGGEIPELVSNHVAALCAPLCFSSVHFVSLHIGPGAPPRWDRNILRI